MQFNHRASVVTVDGKGAGHVDRVVIDPKTKEITHLVIQRGLLQKEDMVVPIQAVTSEREGELTLHLQSSELEFLPVFEEQHYVKAENDHSDVAPPLISLSPNYPGEVPVTVSPDYVVETHLNIPENTVALKEGARVVTSDDKEVGHVAQVVMNNSSEQASHFLVVKGLLVKEQRLIPMNWVEHLTDDEVQLTVDFNAVEKLPLTEALS